MRPLLFCLAAIVAALASTGPSLAWSHHETRNSSSYAGCVCHFGYGNDGCSPAVTCASEGGRCSEACFVRSADNDINR